jgi:hypothetical protein
LSSLGGACIPLRPSVSDLLLLQPTSAEVIVKGYKRPCISDEMDGMKDKEGVGYVGSEHESMISEFETIWEL